jgi:hypothetical protein
MQIARRLYVYLITAASLTALAIGLTNLLELLFQRIGESLTGADVLSGDPDTVRDQVSLHLALIVVALPIWLLHWWLAERELRRQPAVAEPERRSAVRALYLAAALGGSLVVLILATRTLIERAVLEVAGSRRDEPDIEWALAALIVLGALWVYHGWIRGRDMRRGELDGAADWLPRLYLYGAAFAGALLLIFGVAGLLGLAVEALMGDTMALFDERWWSPRLADALAGIGAGLLVWGLHWDYGLRLTRRADWIGAHARSSSLRRLYLYALALVGVFGSLVLLAGVLESVLRTLLDVRQADDEPFTRQLLGPLARLIPFAGAWLYHRLQIVREAAISEAETQAAVRRLYVYAVAAIGLAVGGFGLAGTVALAVDRALEDGATLAASGDPWREDLSRLAALTLVGAAAWLWHWLQAQRWVVAQDTDVARPDLERNALPRRVYLFGTLAVAVIAVLVSLAVVVYRLIAGLLDVSDAARLDESLGAPLATLLVAGAVLLYHGTILRADLAARPDEEPEGASLAVLLTGPPGVALDPILQSLQATLPEGYDLRPTRTHHEPRERD